MAPLGSPALAQTYMESTLPNIGDNVTYEIEIVSGTDPLISAFGSGSHDIIYAPTNMGAMLVATGDNVNYQFAAAVSWGNLYLATSSETPITIDDLDGKELVVFGQNATPDIILQTILDSYTFDVEPTLTYVDSAGTANTTLIADNSKIVLLAEPVLSVAGLNVENLQTIDLQSEWETVTGTSSYPQAGIFVKDTLPKEVVDAYLNEVKISINEANDDPAAVAQMAADLEYGFPVPVLTNAIGRSGLIFKTAAESKDALETYFGYILDFNPALIGNALPEDEFYFE
jgi:NitT/TauT family transport system substrate-binding protein